MAQRAECMHPLTAADGFEETRQKFALLTEWVTTELNLVNKIIVEELHSPVALIPELAGHLIAAGGKRIRPLIMLIAAKLFTIPLSLERICRLAACVEFIHAATLLHDDVIDESSLRRGNATANTIWGNKSSVLVGDFLFSRAFQLMVKDGSLPVLELLSHTAARISEGEVMQQMTVGNPGTTVDEYFNVATAKTAPLFQASAQVPALIAMPPRAEQEALASYGQHLGITFQLVDDILDYTSSNHEMGKNLGDDFREGKITLPVILAFQEGNEVEQAFWKRTLCDHVQKEHDLAQALLYLQKHQAFKKTLFHAQKCAEQAKASLENFTDSQAKTALTNIVDFALTRAF